MTKSFEEGASCLSRYATLWYLNPMLRLGTTKALKLSDLGALPTVDDAETVHGKFAAEWAAELARSQAAEEAGLSKPPRLLMALFRATGFRRLVLCWVLMACSSFLSLALPLLTKVVLQYVSGEIALSGLERGLLVVAGALALVGGAALNAGPLVVMNRAGVQMRVALSVAIYRKALRTSSRGREGQSTGQVVTLMAADAGMFEMFMMQLPNIVTAFPLMCLCFAMMISQIGESAWVFWGFLVVLLPLFHVVFGVLKRLQKELMGVTENRVKLLNDVVAGIRAIKANAWERPFEGKIDDRREVELAVVRSIAYWYCVGMNSVFIAAPELQKLAVLVAYYLLDGSFRPSVIFPTLMLFSIVREPIGAMAQAAVSVTQALVSAKRIGAFLASEEVKLLAGDVRDAAPPVGAQEALSMVGCTFSWASPESVAAAAAAAGKPGEPGKPGTGDGGAGDSDAAKAPALAAELEASLEASGADGAKAKETAAAAAVAVNAAADSGDEESARAPFTLTVEDVRVPPGQLVAIVGAVGSGKSTFLSAALGETAKGAGRMALRGSLSYAAQTPFVMNQSLKDNILFGRPFDERKYRKVLEACALLPDLEQLPGGDETQIGERGITLSGGQKARVSIARAAYANADVVLLDDPLSAVDAHVAEVLFNECVRGLLGSKTRLLVTNQLQHLEKCDLIVVIDGAADGAARVAEQGTFEQLSALGDDSAFARLMSTTVQEGSDDDDEEEEGGGEAHGGGGERLSRLSDLGGSPRDSADGGTPRPSEDLAKAEKLEERKAVAAASSGMELEERLTGKHLTTLARYYLNAAGPKLMATSLFATVVQSVLMVSGFFILGEWGNEAVAAQTSSPTGLLGAGRNRWWVTLFGSTKAAYLVIILCNAVLLAEGRVRAARNLHANALAAVVRSPVWWFDITPIGRILNRFSGDIASVDNGAMIMWGWLTLTSNMLLFTVFSVLLSTQGTMAFVLLPILVWYRRVLEFVRCSTTAVKRMESTTKSPVFSSFSEALVGISTIRAYAQADRFKRINTDMININTNPTLMSRRIGIWLSFQLGVMAALLNCATLALVLIFPDFLSPGLAGVALGFAGSVLKTMQHVCQLTAQFEVELNSVERLRHYCTKLPREQYEPKAGAAGAVVAAGAGSGGGSGGGGGGGDWSCSEGAIAFQQVACRYRDGPIVLDGVDFAVAAREKVGIVGRTGSGKSTILSTLFRIVELERGAILIDGVDIASLPLEQLRSTLCVVPQDPVLFGESVRFNLDPFKLYADGAIWEALRAVQLHSHISGLQGALEHVVEEGGSNFSVGQRQLICIARALLRQPKLLVLDEATASVDQQTDAMLQEMIREHFAHATVLTVAHRLKTIMDSDKVLVLDAGRVAEYDAPHTLLQNEAGIFTGMVDAHGESSAAALRAQAQQQQEQQQQ